MSTLKGDFIGFSINGKHSSDLGIVRTSNGSRYNENLLPTMKDFTVEVPGGDGTYYFGSQYSQRIFSIPIATDCMTEAQFRELKKIIGSKDMVDLIFDEAPYKRYKVKSNGNPTLNFICFDELDYDAMVEAGMEDTIRRRIYKGEGTLNFVAYFPFGRTPNSQKYASQYSVSQYPTKDQWLATSGLRDRSASYDETDLFRNVPIDTTGAESYLYNAGDIPTDIYIYGSSTSPCTIRLSSAVNAPTRAGSSTSDNFDYYLSFSPSGSFRINSRANLVEAVSGKIPTGAVYPVTGGDFFKIPVGYSFLHGSNFTNIEYDYLYY